MTRQLTYLDHLVVAARSLDEGAQYVADTLGATPVAGGRHPGMRTHNRLLGLWGGIYLEIIAPEPDDADAPAGDGANGGVRPRWFGLDEPAMRARLEKGPFLAHWVARVERPRQLSLWQRQYPHRLPPVIPMTRGDYAWHITVPEDGALPEWVDPSHAGATADDTAAATADSTAAHHEPAGGTGPQPTDDTHVIADGSESAASERAGSAPVIASGPSARARRGPGHGIVPTLIQWDLPHHPAAALPETGIALKSLRGCHPHADALRPHLQWLGAAHLIDLDGSSPEPALVAEFETPAGVRVLR